MVASCAGNNCAERAVLRRPKTGDSLCRQCFFAAFETEIHDTITAGGGLFSRGQHVAVAASGGKDSTVLAHVLKVLNDRYDYGLRLTLLSIDEGIVGYRDDSLQMVKQNSREYDLPLLVLSYEELYGWSMDRIVSNMGRRSNCTFCGVLRRQALDRGALQLEVDHVVTGHNADDIAETLLMNVLRGDLARLRRCCDICTPHIDSVSESPAVKIPMRSKPLKYAYEKEIVMYAHFKRLSYFSTECVYSPDAYRGHVRAILKQLEAIRPTAILDLLHSAETLRLGTGSGLTFPSLNNCRLCGHITSQQVCKACILLAGLNQGKPRLAIGKNCSRLLKSPLTTLSTTSCSSDCAGGE